MSVGEGLIVLHSVWVRKGHGEKAAFEHRLEGDEGEIHADIQVEDMASAKALR